jgi:hypothetical protein
MKSNLVSGLTSGLSYKNEVKSIISVQQGTKYGFLVEIESPLGKYYCPLEAYKSKDYALQLLRSRLK